MIKLKQEIHTTNKEPIIYLVGDTYPIRDVIKRMSFAWYGAKKIWWKYKKNMSQTQFLEIKNLGWDTSEIDSSTTSPDISTVQSVQPEIKSTTKNITNKTDTENDAPSERYYGFKVKNSIYSTEFEANIDGEKVLMKVIVDRSYKKGTRKTPLYVFNIFFGDKKVGKIAEFSPSEWGTYNEDDLVLKIPQRIQERFDTKEKSKMYLAYQTLKRLEKRDTELTTFLKTWDEIKFDKDKNVKQFIKTRIPPKFVELSETGYEGKYPIELYLSGTNGITFYTGLEDSQAPYHEYLGDMAITSHISDFEQLNSEIDKNLNEQLENIKQHYLKYLKSFPFSKQEKETHSSEMEEIVSFIGKNFNVEFFKNKLIEKGFVRPSKRGPKGIGMMPVEDVKYIIDDALIRKSVFSRDANNYPNYFYAVLAYYLMRKARNITSWSEPLLRMNIDSWMELAKRYGHDLNFKDVDKYFEQLVILLYKNIFGTEAPKGRMEQFTDFYSGNWGGQSSPTVKEPSVGNPLDNFAQYASTLGINIEEAKRYPRKIYSILATKYHPDVTQEEDKGKAEMIFKELSQLYERIPENLKNLKNAKNWYRRMKI